MRSWPNVFDHDDAIALCDRSNLTQEQRDACSYVAGAYVMGQSCSWESLKTVRGLAVNYGRAASTAPAPQIGEHHHE